MQMDSRIIMLIMALTTSPLLSDNGRKHVAPLATQMDEPDDEEEPEDEDEPVMMDEDDEVSDLQLDIESLKIHQRSSDSQVGQENQAIHSSASDPQISKEEEDDFN
jgi:hypothetical protein